MSAGRSRLGLWHMPPEEREAAIVRREDGLRRRPTVGRGVRGKGKKAEREVAKLWIANGWPKARVQLGSGSIRRYGAGDVPELPGDVAGVEPWVVEVKNDAKVIVPARSGILGEAFVRSTMREHAKLAARLNAIAGRPRCWPVGFFRVPVGRGLNVAQSYRVLVPEAIARQALGIAPRAGITPAFVEVNVSLFFADIARSVLEPSAPRV